MQTLTNGTHKRFDDHDLDRPGDEVLAELEAIETGQQRLTLADLAARFILAEHAFQAEWQRIEPLRTRKAETCKAFLAAMLAEARTTGKHTFTATINGQVRIWELSDDRTFMSETQGHNLGTFDAENGRGLIF